MATPRNVYQCIAAVSKAIAKDGISKGRTNLQQNYKFRGIDDVLNALAPVLAENELVILPRCLFRDVVERQTKSGGTLFYVTVDAEFDFVSAADSSKHTVKMYGEAMDSGDKATNKAMSAAYKYAAIQTFCIPTEGDNDADAQTHEVAPLAKVAPTGYVAWLDNLTIGALEGQEKLRATWEASPKPFREHITHTAPETWAALKAKAVTVDAAKPKIKGAA